MCDLFVALFLLVRIFFPKLLQRKIRCLLNWGSQKQMGKWDLLLKEFVSSKYWDIFSRLATIENGRAILQSPRFCRGNMFVCYRQVPQKKPLKLNRMSSWWNGAVRGAINWLNLCTIKIKLNGQLGTAHIQYSLILGWSLSLGIIG